MTTLQIIGIALCLIAAVLVYISYRLLSREIDEDQRNTFERLE